MSDPTTTMMHRETQRDRLYITPSRQSVVMGGTVQTDVDGATTRYPLSWTELDTPLETPTLLAVDVPFIYTQDS
jgi:hypothetical protein